MARDRAGELLYHVHMDVFRCYVQGEEALNQAKADQELWELLLSKEIEFSKDPAYLNCGANLIYVDRTRG